MQNRKNILLISPNPWGGMKVSKHHYAQHLAGLGYIVFFLNPPTYCYRFNTRVFILESNLPGLKIIEVERNILFYFLRFKNLFLYSKLIKCSINKIISRIPVEIDIVWSFESNLYDNLRLFKSQYTIFHAVDNLISDWQKKPSMSADLNIAVSKSILNELKNAASRTLFINHGINSSLQEFANNKLQEIKSNVIHEKFASVIKIGFSGNLLRSNLDYLFLTICITNYPDFEFVFIGNYDVEDSNLGASENKELIEFIAFLKKRDNVRLHGVVDSSVMPHILDECDVLLVPIKKTKYYDGSNSHKILEYLSTGKVIVSYWVETYSNNNLLVMTEMNDDKSESLLRVFENVVAELDRYNKRELMEERLKFALKNTYDTNITLILENI